MLRISKAFKNLSTRVFFGSYNCFASTNKDKKEAINEKVKKLMKKLDIAEDDKEKMEELQKVFFANMGRYSLKDQRKIFYAYAPAQMMDPKAYKVIEKNLLKDLNKMEFREIPKILKVLSLAKNLSISPSMFTLIEIRIAKNLSLITHEQYLLILESYSRLNIKKNGKIYKMLVSYYLNKSEKMSLDFKIKSLILLIQSKQCDLKLMIEALETLFSQIVESITSLELKTIVFIYLVYFSPFIQEKLKDPEAVKNYKKSQIKDNINQILSSEGNKLDVNDETNIFSSTFFKDVENYNKWGEQFEKKLEETLSGDQKKKLNIYEICILIESFISLKKHITSAMETTFTEIIGEKLLKMVPFEIFRLLKLVKYKEFQATDNFKQNIISNVYSYIDHFLNDFSGNELLKILKIIEVHDLSKLIFYNFISSLKTLKKIQFTRLK